MWYSRVVKVAITSVAAMEAFGAQLGALFTGGEVIELVGDVGAGKTALTKGLAIGMGIEEDVQSPTFTVSRVYTGKNVILAHYDFYRLDDPGIMRAELQETMLDPMTVTVIEWANVVADVLPPDTLQIRMSFSGMSETLREIEIVAGGARSRELMEQLQQ